MKKDILLLGEFSSGKSAFINLLLGVSLLPEKLSATNLPVIKIFKGENDYPSGLWLREGNEKNPRPLSGWLSIPKDWNKFKYAEVTVPDHPILKDEIILWDTPGINSTDSHHSQHLNNFLSEYLPNIDICVFFVRENITAPILSFLKNNPDIIKKLYIIQNVHEVKTKEEYYTIFLNNRALIRKELGLVPFDLLYIGDICDEFNDISENKKMVLMNMI
jgi:GTPase Era involved in 16S rRNA processing